MAFLASLSCISQAEAKDNLKQHAFYDQTNDYGRMVAWRVGTEVESNFIAANGRVIKMRASEGGFSAAIGNLQLDYKDVGNGRVRLTRTFEGNTEVSFWSKSIVEAAGMQFSKGGLVSGSEAEVIAPSQISNEDSQALSDLIAFAESEPTIASFAGISGECWLTMGLNYLVTAGAIGACVGSAGLLCVGALAGSALSWNSWYHSCGPQ
jgi:hypothetical protein